MKPHARSEARHAERLGSPVADRRYTPPVVREIDRSALRRRLSQRDLVVASLMACRHEDPLVPRRWA
jgi:hypothetical protein